MLLAVLIGASKLPKIEHGGSRAWRKLSTIPSGNIPILFSERIGIFAYVGAEVSIGSFLVNYFWPAGASRDCPPKPRPALSRFTGAARWLGRFLGAPLLRGSRPACCSPLRDPAAALVTLHAAGGHTAMWTILAVGFFNSIMFPTIFSLGVAELGPLTGNGSGS